MNQPVIAENDHLETLRNCGGYYSCPKRSDGTRLGPLVGYAGKYDGPDGKKLQWVGDVYANFAKAEMYPHVLRFFAECLAALINSQVGVGNVDAFCGAPIGGYSLADALSFTLDRTVIKAEKKVTAVATAESREKSELVFARHSVESGAKYVIVEDVCNNFSTTDQLVKLICDGGGTVIAIACFLNRSWTVSAQYHNPALGFTIHMVNLVLKPISEWKQDDPAVAEDIAKGNVVWKPKDEWSRLMKAMADHKQQ